MWISKGSLENLLIRSFRYKENTFMISVERKNELNSNLLHPDRIYVGFVGRGLLLKIQTYAMVVGPIVICFFI